jgi:hypothetical protein
VFDERDRYFARNQLAPYQQGDIVLAPVGCFQKHTPPSQEILPAQVGVDVRRQQWSAGSVSHAGRPAVEIPAADVVGQFRPAMIVTHDCTLEKEFNRAYVRLRAQGRTKADAQQAANSDSELERFFNVAPLVPFRAALPSTPDSLIRNSVLGFFPVCAWEERAVDEGVIDLSRVVTVDREVVVGRLAAISTDARRALMFALARFWVFRAPQVAFELEAAVRQRITRVSISAEDPLMVDFELSDGTSLQLVQPPTPPASGGLERAPAA